MWRPWSTEPGKAKGEMPRARKKAANTCLAQMIRQRLETGAETACSDTWLVGRLVAQSAACCVACSGSTVGLWTRHLETTLRKACLSCCPATRHLSELIWPTWPSYLSDTRRDERSSRVTPFACWRSTGGTTVACHRLLPRTSPPSSQSPR